VHHFSFSNLPYVVLHLKRVQPQVKRVQPQATWHVLWRTLMTKSGSLSPSFKYTLMAGAAGQQAAAAAAATARW
jgi:hypothetical protein